MSRFHVQSSEFRKDYVRVKQRKQLGSSRELQQRRQTGQSKQWGSLKQTGKKIGIGLLIFLFTVVLYHDQTLSNLEGSFTDRLTVNPHPTPAAWNDNVKILKIDDASLAKIGRWPWPRSVMANVVNQLMSHGAKMVWTDVLYVEPDGNAANTRAWNQVLRQYPNVLLSAQFDFGPQNPMNQPLHPTRFDAPVYAALPGQIGEINVIPDSDGKVRKVLLGVRDAAGQMVPAVSVRMANALLAKQHKITWNAQNQWFLGHKRIPVNAWNQVNFSYAAPQGNPLIDAQPIYKLLDGEIPYDYYKGAVVLIGPYAPGLQDQFSTPISGSQPTYGVVIQANIVQALLHNQLYTAAPRWLGDLILFLFAIPLYLLLSRLRKNWLALATAVGVFVLYIITVVLVFQGEHLLLPLVYPLMALVLAYVTSLASRYIQERMERRRVTGLFSRYVTKDVVDEILAAKEELKLGGVRKDVSLMFVDIRGFTPLSEQMEPEDVIQVLNEYLDLATRAIFSQEGTIDKFIGDGVMAIFGAPKDMQNHAARAIRAALALRDGAGALEQRLQEQFGKTVRFGIGINSGPAVIGNIGSTDRLDYTAIGDTVNLAARLESNAKPGQILISQQVYERVQDTFQMQQLSPIKVKGKEQPVAIYDVVGEMESSLNQTGVSKIEEGSGWRTESHAVLQQVAATKEKAFLAKEEKQ